MLDCQLEFERLLNEVSKTIDFKKINISSTPGSKYEIIPSATITRMGKLAECMDSSGYDVYLTKLKSIRSELLKNSLKKLMVTDTKAENDNKLMYTRGTHRHIGFLKIFLQILESEKQAIHEILNFTNMSPTEMDMIFVWIVDAPLDYFLKYFVIFNLK